MDQEPKCSQPNYEDSISDRAPIVSKMALTSACERSCDKKIKSVGKEVDKGAADRMSYARLFMD